MHRSGRYRTMTVVPHANQPEYKSNDVKGDNLSIVGERPPGDVVVHRAVQVQTVWSHRIVPPLESVSGGPGHGVHILRIDVKAVDAGEVGDDPALKQKQDNVLKLNTKHI